MSPVARRTFAAGGSLAAGVNGRRIFLKLATGGEALPPTAAELTSDELLGSIQALARIYAELHGGHPGSAARGVERTLRNRSRAHDPDAGAVS